MLTSSAGEDSTKKKWPLMRTLEFAKKLSEWKKRCLLPVAQAHLRLGKQTITQGHLCTCDSQPHGNRAMGSGWMCSWELHIPCKHGLGEARVPLCRGLQSHARCHFEHRRGLRRHMSSQCTHRCKCLAVCSAASSATTYLVSVSAIYQQRTPVGTGSQELSRHEKAGPCLSQCHFSGERGDTKMKSNSGYTPHDNHGTTLHRHDPAPRSQHQLTKMSTCIHDHQLYSQKTNDSNTAWLCLDKGVVAQCDWALP